MPLAPVLLTVGHFYGTLAAARCLGRAGVPVTLAERGTFAPTCWSRWITRRVRCPDSHDPQAFLAFLLEFGATSPGHVLLPSSDDLAWLIADNREALSRSFRLIDAPFEAVNALLDKRLLHEHCQAVGLGVPETWFPTSEEEALSLGEKAGFPLILKPRTQVQLDSHGKGALVEEAAELGPRLRAYLANNHHGEGIRRHTPDIGWPMLQRYHPGGREGIYGLSGYVGAGAEILGVRASRKIFQRPRKLGIGLCFEEARVDPQVLAGLGALFRRVGYRGIFEVELIELGPPPARPVLIDCNPRFYGQMGFDIARGLPLPRFAHADALGDGAALAALASEAREAARDGEQVYCHHFLFELMRRAQTLSGRMSHDEEQRWQRWWEDHRRCATDAVADADDPMPRRVDIAAQLGAIARHPRSFMRAIVLDR